MVIWLNMLKIRGNYFVCKSEIEEIYLKSNKVDSVFVSLEYYYNTIIYKYKIIMII